MLRAMKHRLRELEEAVVDAWPVPEAEELDGWLLRRTGGPSRRGNSVSTLDLGRKLELDARIAAAEAWYAARGQRPIFQIGPAVSPKDLDSVLEARGYAVEGAAVFVSALPAEVVMRTRDSHAVTLTRKPSAGFAEVVQAASRFSATYDAFLTVLHALGTRCRFAVATANDVPVAACVGIASEGRLGVYAMITRPALRRRGAARSLLHGLACHAVNDKLDELYLLVDEDNAPARSLYAQSGFADVFSYHYRARVDTQSGLAQAF
jgi:ribosomal protein S18 acetylase RimI-like enzyme